MNRLPNKIALITGGTQSIGKTIAELFQQHGAHVIISGSRPAEEGAKIARDIHAGMIYLKLDVTLESDWENAMHFIQQKYGRLDILVNNAGIEQPANSNRPQNPEDCSLQDWRTVHQVNLDGVFLGCKHVIPLMKKQENCSIVNIGSRSGLTGIPSSAAYSSSKAAVRNYTKTVAMYCASRRYPIRCNVIHPAAILTNMWEKEFGDDEWRGQRIARFSESIPLRRMGTPMDVAYAALYLASDESRFMTGSEIIIDGGIMSGSAASANETVISVSPAGTES
ncbi:Cyclopentanol dehydrogenase [Aquicella siphonis]|uniref:Cyclopentanol dehydrogenase n=1 Tax=Aquicella siphonis TaxID=254247 RepID=A0A5E4PGG8_9COXI|nr:SDR family oxidoreductase [Aquicella siphonis]VVC76059.1 Cyclopentanol dehydrogenase [Aquicella siphonis]